MAQETWLQRIRRKRRAQTFRAVMALVWAGAVWLGVGGLGVLVWSLIFHHLPPGGLMWRGLCGVGALVLIWLERAPLAPMKGPDPEVIAADEFFHGPQR